MVAMVFMVSAVLLVSTVTGDKPQQPQQTNAWTLKYSDQSRGGRSQFLNIPIHYGDWVPITAAKALVEEVARGRLPSKHSQHARPAEKKAQEGGLTGGEAERRVDNGDVLFVSQGGRGQSNPRQYQTNFRYHSKHPANKNNRRQDSSKSIRYPPQAHKKHIIEKQQKQQNRRNHKKPPPTNHFNQIGQNTRTKSSFSFVPDFNTLQALNPFNFFDQSRLTFTTPRAPLSQQPLTGGSQDKSYQESFNAIQTIPAPDLSKFGGGPPIIELDSGADGEIILGRPFHVGPDHDHLASFVSVDFDGFSPGDNSEKKAKQRKQKKEKQNLSIIVEGKSSSKTRDETDLVKFLNNDQGDNAAAFVIPSDRAVPQGFAKIDLPFMDPTQHKGELPKAFIAPKGIAIPDGYKGKPLPQQPSDEVTTERVLIHASKHDEERPVSLFDRRPTSTFQRTPATNQVEIKATPENVRLSSTSSSLFRGSLEKNKQYKKDFLNKIKLKAREKYDKADSQERQESNSRGKFYVNNKIKEARKEFQYRPPSESSLPPADVVIPVENKLNIFKAVSDQEVVSTETPLIDVISAGDYDDDPISLVFEPEQVALTQSTLEQAESAEEESTSVETSTNFAPTVITTTLVDSTTVASSAETTTVSATTTVSPTTVVTRSSSASSTITTTTTTTTTTTSDNIVKVTTEDPFVRLEEVRKKKYKFGKEKTYQGDLSFGDDLDTVESISTETPPFNFAEKFINSFRTRKFTGGSEKNGENFGKRIVLKKRPIYRRKPFNNDRLAGSIVPTPNPRFFQRNRSPSSGSPGVAAPSGGEEKFDFKKKLRPHFDGGFVPGPWRRPIRPARRSTVAPPITVDAEIYEVHPETRLRITTQSPSAAKKSVSQIQTTTRQPASPSQDSDYSYQDDYVYEPTTQEPAKAEAEETTTPESDASPPLEYQEYVPTVETEVVTTTVQTTSSTEEVHETADKHSVISFTETSTDHPEDEEDEEEENIEEVNIVDDFDNEISDQRVEESQQVETTWNGVSPSEEQRPATTSTRLSSYEKNVDISKFGADTEYKQSDLTPQVNEHGKPLADTEKAKADDYATWQASIEPVRSYYEINRSDNLPPVVRIEEVEITEPKDYSEPDIIYDETKAGFEDDSSKDSFSVPVSVAFNVPDDDSTVTQTETSDTTTASSLLQDTESTSEVIDQTTTVEDTQSTTLRTQTTTVAATTTITTIAEVPTTSVTQEAAETTTIPATTSLPPTTTFSRTYSLINRNRPSKYEDVLLGLRGPTSSTTRQPSTTEVIDLNKSAHSVPDNLWSSYKKSLYETSTTRASETTEDLNETTETSVNIEIVKDLPKPTEHESEVLVVEKFPKSYKGYKGKNREKWINSRRFPKPRRPPFFPLAPKQNNKPETTPQTTTQEVKVSEEVSESSEQVQSVFSPTAPPSKPSEEVKTESAKHPLLNEIKNAVYPRQKAISSIFSKPELPTRSKQKSNGVPRGANTDIFRSFGGSKLSQAEFERSILGVSTATEISVKSMICVKGRCFNADDMGKLLPTN